MTAVLISHENDKATYTTEVAYDIFEKAVQAAYQRTKSRYQIPGFRKGHAPRKIIEANYGKGIFYEDAVQAILPEAIRAAEAELELEAIGMPDVDIQEILEGEPLVFEITTQTMPHPTLGDYRQLEVTRREVHVEEAEVDRRVEQEQRKNVVARPVEDRPAQMGDVVTLDFEGFLGDEPFAGGKGEGVELTLGSGQFIPGFEEQVVGHAPEEAFDLFVTFPEDYHAEELKGKEARFHVQLHAIREEILPELDDEFAQDVSEFDTLEEYKASLRAELEKEQEARNRTQEENEAVQKLVELSDIPAPEPLVEAQMDRELEMMNQQLQSMGATLSDYMRYTGSTIEQMREQFRTVAGQRVQRDLALQSLVEEQNLTASEEEVEAEMRRLAEHYGARDVDDFIRRMKEAGNEKMVERELKHQKALDYLMTQVQRVEAPAVEEAPTEDADEA